MNVLKITAIIFISLFILENLLFIWLVKIELDDMQREEDCYYTVCEGFDNAYYEDDLCYCLTDGEIKKTKLMDSKWAG